MIASWVARGGTLGLYNNDWRQTGNIVRFIMEILLTLLLLAMVFNPDFFQTPRIGIKMAAAIVFYLPWALLQQLILNGYFANRLRTLYANDSCAAYLGGMFFATAHLPNPTLFAVCLVSGIASSYFFLKSRNLWPLALAHAIIGVAIMYLLPASWHHGMTVGPAFFAK